MTDCALELKIHGTYLQELQEWYGQRYKTQVFLHSLPKHVTRPWNRRQGWMRQTPSSSGSPLLACKAMNCQKRLDYVLSAASMECHAGARKCWHRRPWFLASQVAGIKTRQPMIWVHKLIMWRYAMSRGRTKFLLCRCLRCMLTPAAWAAAAVFTMICFDLSRARPQPAHHRIRDPTWYIIAANASPLSSWFWSSLMPAKGTARRRLCHRNLPHPHHHILTKLGNSKKGEVAVRKPLDRYCRSGTSIGCFRRICPLCWLRNYVCPCESWGSVIVAYSIMPSLYPSTIFRWIFIPSNSILLVILILQYCIASRQDGDSTRDAANGSAPDSCRRTSSWSDTKSDKSTEPYSRADHSTCRMSDAGDNRCSGSTLHPDCDHAQHRVGWL